MKLYIDGPEAAREGVYFIITEYGEGLANHYCSHKGFARGDLEAHRPTRQAEWTERFGSYQVLYIGEDGMTSERLLALNREYRQTGQVDG